MSGGLKCQNFISIHLLLESSAQNTKHFFNIKKKKRTVCVKFFFWSLRQPFLIDLWLLSIDNNCKKVDVKYCFKC